MIFLDFTLTGPDPRSHDLVEVALFKYTGLPEECPYLEIIIPVDDAVWDIDYLDPEIIKELRDRPERPNRVYSLDYPELVKEFVGNGPETPVCYCPIELYNLFEWESMDFGSWYHGATGKMELPIDFKNRALDDCFSMVKVYHELQAQ